MEDLVRMQNLGKTFQTAHQVVSALDGITATLNQGEFVSIIGPSGCGKSTLLKIIAGLAPYDSGRLEWLWDRSSRLGQDIGFVFQEPVLLPWKNVLDNARFPADMFGWPRAQSTAKVRSLLHQVGLGNFEKSFPHELSGGMRQRVAIVRAWMYDPVLLLMDEPFGALDMLTRERMNDLLVELWAQDSKTVLFVTHSVDEAVYLSDRVIVMTPRPGRVYSELPIALGRPRGAAVRDNPLFHRYLRDIRAMLVDTERVSQ